MHLLQCTLSCAGVQRTGCTHTRTQPVHLQLLDVDSVLHLTLQYFYPTVQRIERVQNAVLLDAYNQFCTVQGTLIGGQLGMLCHLIACRMNNPRSNRCGCSAGPINFCLLLCAATPSRAVLRDCSRIRADV
jgi:hypothetical protein